MHTTKVGIPHESFATGDDIAKVPTDVPDLLDDEPLDDMGATTILVDLHGEGGKEVHQGEHLISKRLVGVKRDNDEPSLVTQGNVCKKGSTPTINYG